MAYNRFLRQTNLGASSSEAPILWAQGVIQSPHVRAEPHG